MVGALYPERSLSWLQEEVEEACDPSSNRIGGERPCDQCDPPVPLVKVFPDALVGGACPSGIPCPLHEQVLGRTCRDNEQDDGDSGLDDGLIVHFSP